MAVGIELEWALNSPFFSLHCQLPWSNLPVKLLLCALTSAFLVTVVRCVDDVMYSVVG